MALPAVLGAVAAGMQILGSGFQIAQAIDAKKKQRDAERSAKESLAQARRKLSVNRLEGIQVPLEAYESSMRETTAQTMQNLEALREADARTLAAGVGKLSAASGAQTERTRQQMARDIAERDKMIAQEQATIDRTLAGLSLEEAAGAQAAAAQREQQAAMGFSSAIKGIGAAGQTLYENSKLYGSGRQAQLQAAANLQNLGQFQGMNVRQARRQMLASGQYDANAINNLAQGLTPGGNQISQSVIPVGVQPIGVQPVGMGVGIQPIDLSGIRVIGS